MKKFIIFSLLLFLININIVKANNEIISLTSLSLNKNTLTLEVGKSEILNPNKVPANSNEELIWTSSDNNIVKVENGKLTALKKGSVVITLENSSKTLKDTCKVTVIEQVKKEEVKQDIKIKSITLDKKSLSLKVGDSVKLNPTILPSNASNKELIWESSGKGVIKIENGVVTALKKGNAIVTVYSKDKSVKTTCNIIVNEKDNIELQSIYLNKKSLSLKVDDVVTLQANVLPTRTTDKELIWSSNNDVVKVENGVVTALKKGTSIITVSNKDKTIKATCTIIVNEKQEENKKEEIKKIESITLNRTSITIFEGNIQELSASILPIGVNEELIWKSSNNNIVTVENGKVKALKKGKAVITVSDINNKVSSSCEVEVLETDEKIERKFDENDMKMVITVILTVIVCIVLYKCNKTTIEK